MTRFFVARYKKCTRARSALFYNFFINSMGQNGGYVWKHVSHWETINKGSKNYFQRRIRTLTPEYLKHNKYQLRCSDGRYQRVKKKVFQLRNLEFMEDTMEEKWML